MSTWHRPEGAEVCTDRRSRDFDLTDDQKSRLLKLGHGSKHHEQSPDRKQEKVDILYEVLNSSLPLNPSVINSLPIVMRGLSSRLHSLAGQPIGDLLQDSTTDITTITRIKQYAKESGSLLDSDDKREIFLVVYYAAIASALLFRNEKITQHSYADLEQFFCSFARKDWMLDELVSLFTRASQYCLEKTQRQNSRSP